MNEVLSLKQRIAELQIELAQAEQDQRDDPGPINCTICSRETWQYGTRLCDNCYQITHTQKTLDRNFLL